MASDVTSADRNRSTQDLATLQEQFKKQRQEVIEKNEAQIQALKKTYDEKKQATTKDGAAAVNHTRKLTAEQVAQIRDQQAERIGYETKAQDSKYQSVKQYGDRKIDALEKSIDQQREHNKAQLSAAREREREIGDHEYKVTTTIQKKQAALRSQAEQQASQDITELRNKTSLERQAVLHESRDAIARAQNEAQGKIKQTKVYEENSILTEKKAANEKLKNFRGNHQATLDTERMTAEKNLNQIRDSYRNQIATQKTQNETQLELEKTTAAKKIHDARDMGVEQLQGTHQYYESEISRTHKEGDQKIGDQRLQQEKLMMEQKLNHQAQIEQDQQKLQADKEQALITHRTQLDRTQNLYRKELEDQRGEFEDAYIRNANANDSVIEGQQMRIIQALDSQKRKLMESVGRHSNKSTDPFYHITKPNARLSETANYYYVEAEVPEHEKENIDIRVKADSVIVAGKRSFADKLDNNGRKISTNAFQSFREEIPLARPVAEKLVEKSYVNGMLRVKIPKIG